MENKSIGKLWPTVIVLVAIASAAFGYFAGTEITAQKQELTRLATEVIAQNAKIEAISVRPVRLEAGVIDQLRVGSILLVNDDGRTLMQLSEVNGYPTQAFYDNNGKLRIGLGFKPDGLPTIDIRNSQAKSIIHIQETTTPAEGSTGLIIAKNPTSRAFAAVSSGSTYQRIAVSNGRSGSNVVLGTDTFNNILIAVSDGQVPRVALGTSKDREAAFIMLGTDGQPDLLAASTAQGEFGFYSESTPAQRLWKGLSNLSTLKSIFDIMRGR